MKKINTTCLFPYFQMHRNDRRDLKVVAPESGKKTPSPQSIQE